MEKYGRAGKDTDENTAHAHWMLIPQTTDTHSQYVILIAFPLQNWMHSCASLLRYST